MNYEEVKVDMGTYHSELEGDVGVRKVTPTTTRAWGECIVVEWGHDGIECIDLYDTTDGHIEVFVSTEHGWEEQQDEIFMAVYTSPKMCLRIDGDTPTELRESFLYTITQV